MTSNKQRRTELAAKRTAKHAAKELAARQASLERAETERIALHGVLVNTSALAPTGSYSRPEFVARGYYLDKPVVCQGCGKEEVWTARQQKWWYEVAKGDMWTTARLCRPCRRKEQARSLQL